MDKSTKEFINNGKIGVDSIGPYIHDKNMYIRWLTKKMSCTHLTDNKDCVLHIASKSKSSKMIGFGKLDNTNDIHFLYGIFKNGNLGAKALNLNTNKKYKAFMGVTSNNGANISTKLLMQADTGDKKSYTFTGNSDIVDAKYCPNNCYYCQAPNYNTCSICKNPADLLSSKGECLDCQKHLNSGNKDQYLECIGRAFDIKVTEFTGNNIPEEAKGADVLFNIEIPKLSLAKTNVLKSLDESAFKKLFDIQLYQGKTTTSDALYKSKNYLVRYIFVEATQSIVLAFKFLNIPTSRGVAVIKTSDRNYFIPSLSGKANQNEMIFSNRKFTVKFDTRVFKTKKTGVEISMVDLSVSNHEVLFSGIIICAIIIIGFVANLIFRNYYKKDSNINAIPADILNSGSMNITEREACIKRTWLSSSSTKQVKDELHEEQVNSNKDGNSSNNSTKLSPKGSSQSTNL